MGSRTRRAVLRPALVMALMALGAGAAGAAPEAGTSAAWDPALPAPARKGTRSLEELLQARRSVREFAPTPLTRPQLAQLLWAAQGTRAGGLRTAPSAGALYPLELYVATAAGVGHYEPARHRLERRSERDARPGLRQASGGQPSVGEAPAVFVIAAVVERTERKYGTRSARYVAMEAGHAAQNLLLEATALGLAGVPVGAFEDAGVARVLGLPPGETPLYLIPVGHARDESRP